MIYQVEITLKKYKKIQSNLTGETIEFSHNNMEPFFGSTAKQNMDLDKPSRNLDIFTGGNVLKKPKQEVGPLFDSEKQNIFGICKIMLKNIKKI